jgi:transcriptional regulator with XRE-family HTH domain
MSDVTSIDLDLPKKLQDREYRKRFFLAEASARIAEQIIVLRRKRGLNQKQVAELVGTRQPAISRAESADYHNWSFNTLRGIADALDARIKVLIEPSEEIVHEYDRNSPKGADDSEPLGDAAKAAADDARQIYNRSQDQDRSRRIVTVDDRLFR